MSGATDRARDGSSGSTTFRAALCVSLLTLCACSHRVHTGAHDAGSTGACSAHADCPPEQRCVCGTCTADGTTAPAACDVDCESARAGDACTIEGSRCESGACSALVCRSGAMRFETGDCDAGAPCECPAPPPGCYYDGAPCLCSSLVCPGEVCGRTTCAPGTVCCNPSCGLCAPVGSGCEATECVPDCSPQDARGDGTCERAFGLWAWDGTRCAQLTGCMTCVGADCAATFTSAYACERAFSGCERRCGGFAGATCLDHEYCAYHDPLACGDGDALGVCLRRPEVCTPTSSPAACGCDGVDYGNACEAHRSGVEVRYEGVCTPGCAPDDARGVGPCDASLGVVWTGTQCVNISGCSCEGSACERLAATERECRIAHEHCAASDT